MRKITLFIKIKSLPDKRDEVWQLWQKHIKDHLEDNSKAEFISFCFDAKDKNTIWIFELFHDQFQPEIIMESDWFANFQNEVIPLLENPPEVAISEPVWIKKDKPIELTD